MILTEKQALFLFHLLHDTLTKNIVGYLSTTHEARRTLLGVIMNQQSDDPIQINAEIKRIANDSGQMCPYCGVENGKLHKIDCVGLSNK